jgi:hypothetical protein
MRPIAVTVLLLVTLAILSGCKKKLSCDPADSEAVCKGFQQCLRSDTSAEVCRMAEQDAIKIQKGTNH